jgi:hypothetical protein
MCSILADKAAGKVFCKNMWRTCVLAILDHSITPAVVEVAVNSWTGTGPERVLQPQIVTWLVGAARAGEQTTTPFKGGLVATALIVVPARATPSSGVTTTILAKSLFDEIHVRARAHTADRWKAQLKTHRESDVYVVDNKFAPGGTAGWHSHPGSSLILVVADADLRGKVGIVMLRGDGRVGQVGEPGVRGVLVLRS